MKECERQLEEIGRLKFGCGCSEGDFGFQLGWKAALEFIRNKMDYLYDEERCESYEIPFEIKCIIADELED